MNIERLKIGEIIPYEKNNRTHPTQQIERIGNSIKEFGFNQPIVIDETNTILVGHGRFLAAKKLKLKEVPVLRKQDLTDVQKRAYRILDNKLQNDSDWELENLEAELQFLEVQEFDLESWGLDDLLKTDEEEAEVVDDEYEETEQTEIYIKEGDLIELGAHRVLCGDSTKEEFVAELLQGKETVLMVTDPPYGVEYDPNWRNEAAEKGLISYAAISVGIVENDSRIDWSEAYKLFDAQVAYVWHAGRHASEVSDNLKESGYKIISQIIWAKPMFAISRGDYHWQHEPCWYAVKEKKTHNWQGARDQSTLWKIERGCKEKTGHGTEKPINCMAIPMKNNTKKGQLVVDPFLGSGTTLIAADQLDRICYGMEISPKYCQVIIDRYQKHCTKSGKDCTIKINGELFDGQEETREDLV